MNRILKKIQQYIRIPIDYLLSILLGLKKFNLEDSIVIFSEARGGSTWLMELLNEIPNTCINWEPFRVGRGVFPLQLKFGKRPYIPQYDKNVKYRKMIEKMLNFSISSSWTRKYLTVSTLWNSKIIITKFVRANLLIPYLLENFQFNRPPIMLLRHPIDISISRMKTWTNHTINLHNIEIPNCINNERFIKYSEYINQLDTPLEVAVATWCINNAPIVNQLHTFDNLLVVFYSDLLLDPQEEFRRIVKELKIDSMSEDILESIQYRKASSTAIKGLYIATPEEQLQKNFKKLDNNTKDKIQNIFDHFEIKIFDAYSFSPKKKLLDFSQD